jgi:hypothetical protein
MTGIMGRVSQLARYLSQTTGGCASSTTIFSNLIFVFPLYCFLSNILQNANAVHSPKTYGQKYDPQLFEPRRWIDRPGGVGEIWEGHAAFGFGRRYVQLLPLQVILLVFRSLPVHLSFA